MRQGRFAVQTISLSGSRRELSTKDYVTSQFFREVSVDRLLSFQATAEIRVTDHAALRIQQRGIPPWFLQLLVEHGKTTHDGHGAVLKSISKSASRDVSLGVGRRRGDQICPAQLFLGSTNLQSRPERSTRDFTHHQVVWAADGIHQPLDFPDAHRGARLTQGTRE